MKKRWLSSFLGFLSCGVILFAPAGCGTDAPPDAVITGPSDGEGITVPGYMDINGTFSYWVGPLQFKVQTPDSGGTSTDTGGTTAKALSKAIPGVEMTFVVTGDFDLSNFSRIRLVDGTNITTLNGSDDVISYTAITNDAGVAQVFLLAQVTCGGGATERTVQMGVEAYTPSDLAVWDIGGITVQCTPPAAG